MLQTVTTVERYHWKQLNYVPTDGLPQWAIFYFIRVLHKYRRKNK